MNTDEPMTVVIALIRPNMEGRVVQAPHDLPEFPGFFIGEGRGQGRGRGAGGAYISAETELSYHRTLRMEIVCPSASAEMVCSRIREAAWTGRKGDGVVFTTAALTLTRIREGAPRSEGNSE